MTCDTCKKKATCTELCEKAEVYVNQDTVCEQSEARTFKFSLETTLTMDRLEDIEERKTQELIFYFQKINSMKDSQKKAILSMVYFGIPVPSIALYTKTDIRQVYRLLGK
jgi:hypothetical protein